LRFRKGSRLKAHHGSHSARTGPLGIELPGLVGRELLPPPVVPLLLPGVVGLVPLVVPDEVLPELPELPELVGAVSAVPPGPRYVPP
jgi:hypothetical protein